MLLYLKYLAYGGEQIYFLYFAIQRLLATSYNSHHHCSFHLRGKFRFIIESWYPW